MKTVKLGNAYIDAKDTYDDFPASRFPGGLENDPSLSKEYKLIINDVWSVLTRFYDNDHNKFPDQVKELGRIGYCFDKGSMPNVVCGVRIIKLLDSILQYDEGLSELESLRNALRMLAGFDLLDRVLVNPSKG